MSTNTLTHIFTPHGNIIYMANDFRQTVCIAVAGTIMLSISTFYDVQHGVFFVVYLLMLMSLVPIFNRRAARQFVLSAAMNCAETVLVVGYPSQWPVVMTLAVFALYVICFRFMSQGPLFPLGSMGVVCQSTMFNFMSYPTSNQHTLVFPNMEACVLAVALSALLHHPISDVEPRKLPPRIEKGAARIRHGSLLSDTVVTAILVVFQICDLSDSLSALMVRILILFPMYYHRAMISSIWHVAGVVLTCLYILVVQLVIYDFSNRMILMMPLIGLGLVFNARLYVMEKMGAGVGFASITTIGTMFGQNLHPYQDLVFSSLYCITSMTASLMVTLALVFLMHRFLNCFAATHFVVSG